MTTLYSVRAGKLPPALVYMYQRYSFTAADDNPAFAYDDIRGWMDITVHAQSVLDDAISKLRKTDPRLAAQESEFRDKLSTCWRLRGMGTLFVENPATLSCMNEAQAEMLRPALRARAAYYKHAVSTRPIAELHEMTAGARLRIDKGKGAPYWFPGTEKETPAAFQRLYQAAGNVDEYLHLVAAAGQARMPVVLQTSGLRIQSSRRPVPLFAVRNGSLTNVGEVLGPKNRRIAAQGFAMNHLWAPVGNLLRTLMSESPDARTTGTFGPARDLSLGHRFTAAVDLRSYDTTVSLELLTALREEIISPVLDILAQRGVISRRDARALIELDALTQSMPILLPPRNVHEDAYVATAYGQTRSGENLTSWKGTELNRARCDLKIRDVKHATGREVRAVNYGDDTVIFTDHADAIDAWLDQPKAYGFEEEAAADATFLMKRLPYGYSYLGRMIMGSIDREPTHEPDSMLDAAAAFAIRKALLTGHPTADSYFDAITFERSPDRMRNAVIVAKQTSNAVALTTAAASLKAGKRFGALTDDRIDALEAIAEQPMIDPSMKQAAAQAILTLNRQLDLDNRAVVWRDFVAASASLSQASATALIRMKAYTRGLK